MSGPLGRGDGPPGFTGPPPATGTVPAIPGADPLGTEPPLNPEALVPESGMEITPDPARSAPPLSAPLNDGGSANTGCLLPASFSSVSYCVITRAASSCAWWLRSCFSIVSLINPVMSRPPSPHFFISSSILKGMGSGILFFAVEAACVSL